MWRPQNLAPKMRTSDAGPIGPVAPMASASSSPSNKGMAGSANASASPNPESSSRPRDKAKAKDSRKKPAAASVKQDRLTPPSPPAAMAASASAPPSPGPSPRTPIMHWTELLPRLRALQRIFEELEELGAGGGRRPEVADSNAAGERGGVKTSQAQLSEKSISSRQSMPRETKRVTEGAGTPDGAQKARPGAVTFKIPEKRTPLRKRTQLQTHTRAAQQTLLQSARHEADLLWAEVLQFERALSDEIDDLRDVLRRVKECKPMVELIKEKYAERRAEVGNDVVDLKAKRAEWENRPGVGRSA